MMKKNTIIFLLKNLWRELSSKRRIEFSGIFLLMVISAIAEMANIGAILSFLTALVSPNKFLNNPHLTPLLEVLDIHTSKQILFAVAVFFAFVVLLTNALRLMLIWSSTRVLYGTGADLSIKAYKRILHQPYIVHVSRNSSQVLNSMHKIEDIVRALNMTLNLASCFILIIAIFIAVVFVNPLVAIGSLCGFGIIYLGIIYITKNRLMRNSKCVASESSNVIKTLQEGVGGIRDILIDGTQEVFCHAYQEATLRVRRSQGNIEIIKASPRYFVESFGMILILFLSYLIAINTKSKDEIIPILGALALASQRLLPLLQSAYTSWTGIRGVHASLVDSLNLLKEPIEFHNMSSGLSNGLEFNHQIELLDLEFKYDEDGIKILKGINLSILKGERIGIIGKTGGGKSSLMDVLMGLLEPTDGIILIDGVPITKNNISLWKSHIAHVPQSIYLSDNSIEENIAFGVPFHKIDDSRVRSAAEQANIAQVIDSWPNKYKTIVGERGVRLSGGQRQRIGIARAIYKNADVIIFDEATSALDNETEHAVMNAIKSLSDNLTIFIVAHRLTTLKGCNKIIELDNGSVKRIVSYEEMMLTAYKPN